MSFGRQWYDDARHAVRYFLLRRLPTCRSLAPLMSESLERRLTVRETLTLRLHLAVCVWCHWYLRQLGELREQARARGREDDVTVGSSASDLTDEARERIRRALEKRAG